MGKIGFICMVKFTQATQPQKYFFRTNLLYLANVIRLN